MTRAGARGPVWAVLPVKGFARGKSRLGAVLGDAARMAFARGLFSHVLGTLRTTEGIAQVLVLTEDDEVEALALEARAEVLRDTQGANLARVIDAGLRRAEAAGASAALVCMADLPRVSAPELAQVLAALAAHAVVVAPDLAEAGTNVLALSPPSVLATCFGHEDSFTRHVAQAAKRGLSLEVVRLPGLCFDVDGPEDLARL